MRTCTSAAICVAAALALTANATTFQPPEQGQAVNGYEDTFDGATLNPDWLISGGGSYEQADGVLTVSGTGADPAHLFYDPATSYNATDQEILALVRPIGDWVTADQSRGGVVVAGDAGASQGVNILMRKWSGENFTFLNDGIAWGPDLHAPDVPEWQAELPGTWYWMRLKMNAAGTTASTKIWKATDAEPASWNDWSASFGRSGLAGITAPTGTAGAQFEVDYVLIKASGLPAITVQGNPPAATDPPVADAGPDQTPTLVACDPLPYTVTLDGSGSSDDVGIVSYLWAEGATVIAEGPNAVLTDISVEEGVHTFTLRVEDGEGQIDTDTVTVTISHPGSAAPTAVITTPTEGETLQTNCDGAVQVSAADSTDDCEIVKYTWKDFTSGDVLLEADEPTALLAFAGGVSAVTLEVENHIGLTAQSSVSFTVEPNCPAVDNVWGPYGIKHGDISGTAQQLGSSLAPYRVPAGEVELKVVDQWSASFNDPAANAQPLFDSVGNIYYVHYSGKVISRTPALTLRWESVLMDEGVNYPHNDALVIGERYVYGMGCGRDEDPNQTTPPNLVPIVYAFDKQDGSTVWSQELTLGGVWEIGNKAGRPKMTLYNGTLYILGNPDDAGDVVKLWQVDASSGTIARVDTVDTGSTYWRPGHLGFIPDYDASNHALFFAEGSDDDNDFYPDAHLLLINKSTGAVSNPWWNTWPPPNSSDAQMSRVFCTDAWGTPQLFSVGRWNFDQNQFWSYDPATGDATGFRAGYFANTEFSVGDWVNDAAAMSLDGKGVWVGCKQGSLYKYETLDASGTNIDTEARFYGSYRRVGPRVITLEDENGDELLLTAFCDERGTGDYGNPNDTRDPSYVVLLKPSDDPAMSSDFPTEADLDDAPLIIDNIVVTYDNGIDPIETILVEDFESYAVGPFPFDTSDWYFEDNGSGAPASRCEIIEIEGPGGTTTKALMMDPFGTYVTGEDLLMKIDLPTPVGGTEDALLRFAWDQQRGDWLDNALIGFDIGPKCFEWDVLQKATTIATDPSQGGVPHAAGSVDAWDVVELDVTYAFSDPGGPTGYAEVFVNGTNDPGDPNNPKPLGEFDQTLQLETFMIRFFGTGDSDGNYTSLDEWRKNPGTPVAMWQANEYIGEAGGDLDWGYPAVLTMGPLGDIYVVQWGYGCCPRRWTRLRITPVAPQGCPGDCDCDGDRDYFDISYFLQAIQGEQTWTDYHVAQTGNPPSCTYLANCDVDGDGMVGYFDINPFLDVLGQACE